MEETIREMNLLCEQKRGQLDFQVGDLIKTYQTRIKKGIYDVISDTLSFIRPEQVERFIDKNLVEVLTSRFKRYNNTKFDNLRALNSTLLNLSNSRSPEKLKRIMHFERNEMERRLNPEEFSSIITEFANNLSRRLTDFLTRNNFIFDQRLEEAIADIRHYVPIKVNTAVEELFGKYAGLLQY